MTLNSNDLTINVAELLIVKKFREALVGGALFSYSLLHENSIDIFNMLAENFLKDHAKAMKVHP